MIEYAIKMPFIAVVMLKFASKKLLMMLWLKLMKEVVSIPVFFKYSIGMMKFMVMYLKCQRSTDLGRSSVNFIGTKTIIYCPLFDTTISICYTQYINDRKS